MLLLILIFADYKIIQVKLWNSETKELIKTFEGHNEPVYSVQFNQKGTILATGSEDNNIKKIWNLIEKENFCY